MSDKSRKCIRMLDTGNVVRTFPALAAFFVTRQRAVYTTKGAWKSQGRKRAPLK